jgi:hypothetical protein
VGDFGESVLRVAILVPDAIRDNLECLIALSMPQESINNMQFYIGNDNKMKNEKGGVPADVFSSGKTCIGHMMKAGKQCKLTKNLSGCYGLRLIAISTTRSVLRIYKS